MFIDMTAVRPEYKATQLQTHWMHYNPVYVHREDMSIHTQIYSIACCSIQEKGVKRTSKKRLHIYPVNKSISVRHIQILSCMTAISSFDILMVQSLLILNFLFCGLCNDIVTLKH